MTKLKIPMLVGLLLFTTMSLAFAETNKPAFAPVPAAKADDTSTALKKDLEAFGKQVCDIALKGDSKGFVALFSFEFLLRLTVTEDMLAETGQTIEDLANQLKENAASELADDDNKPLSCTVLSAIPADCASLSEKIAKSADFAGDSGTDPEKVKAAGKVMDIQTCGEVTVSSRENKDGGDKPGEFTETATLALGKIDGAWAILAMIMQKDSDVTK